jgi:hypothetical protein
MSFWSNTTAAPQWWHTLFPTRPGYLRIEPAQPIPPPHPYTIRRASIQIAVHIAAFWNTFYRGDDWYMDISEHWVKSYLMDPDVIILYAHDAEHIKATIVSSPVSSIPVVMSHGGRIPLRCIEGLCLADDVRGKGLAGTMIAAVDSVTSQRGPCAHIWYKELPTDPGVFTTAASIKTYAYIQSERATFIDMPITAVPWHEFSRSWNPYRYIHPEQHTVVSETPLQRNQSIDVWNVDYKGRSVCVVVLHTHRRTLKTHQPIYEIIWASLINNDIFTRVSSQYKNAVVFTTDADASWNGWIYGRSGVHATYMYNYLPPLFRNCEFICIREEI